MLLADEAWYRTLERALGIRREDANIAAAIGLLTLANAVYERAHVAERLLDAVGAERALGCADPANTIVTARRSFLDTVYSIPVTLQGRHPWLR